MEYINVGKKTAFSTPRSLGILLFTTGNNRVLIVDIEDGTILSDYDASLYTLGDVRLVGNSDIIVNARL